MLKEKDQEILKLAANLQKAEDAAIIEKDKNDAKVAKLKDKLTSFNSAVDNLKADLSTQTNLVAATEEKLKERANEHDEMIKKTQETHEIALQAIQQELDQTKDQLAAQILELSDEEEEMARVKTEFEENLAAIEISAAEKALEHEKEG